MARWPPFCFTKEHAVIRLYWQDDGRIILADDTSGQVVGTLLPQGGTIAAAFAPGPGVGPYTLADEVLLLPRRDLEATERALHEVLAYATSAQEPLAVVLLLRIVQGFIRDPLQRAA
jgi:hypothetical protein